MRWAIILQSYLAQALRTRFGRNALVLVSMTAAAQAVPVLVSPILTRIFNPKDLGILGLYMAGLSIASIFSAGRYDLAVMFADDDTDAGGLVVLSMLISTSVGFVMAILIAAFQSKLAVLIGRPDLGTSLYCMALGAGLIGYYNALMQWLNRRGEYAKMGRNRLYQTVITAGVSIVLGLFGFGYLSLLTGAVIGLLVTTAMLLWEFLPALTKQSAEHMRLARIFSLASTFRHFPMHVFPAQGLGTTVLQLPIFLVSSNFGTAFAGYFSLANRVITVPGSLIGTALGDVYRQHATETFRSQGRFDRLFIRTATMTFCLALPPLFVLVCFAPTLFAFVFGPHWRPAGDFARILAIAAFVQFVCLPVDKSAIITGRTGYLLLWNLLMAAGVLGLWSFVVFGGMSFESFLLLYTALVSIMYLFDLSMQYIFSWRPRQSGAT